MNATKAIRARVEAFIQDYAKWNAKFYKPDLMGQLDWDAARKDFEVIAVRHFVPHEDIPGVALAIGYPRAHAPDSERIVSITESSETEHSLKLWPTKESLDFMSTSFVV